MEGKMRDYISRWANLGGMGSEEAASVQVAGSSEIKFRLFGLCQRYSGGLRLYAHEDGVSRREAEGDRDFIRAPGRTFGKLNVKVQWFWYF